MTEYPVGIPRTNFVVYDPSTGRIKRSGNCPADMLPFQPEENEIVLDTGDVFHSPMDHTVSDGVVVNVPPPPVEANLSMDDQKQMAAMKIEAAFADLARRSYDADMLALVELARGGTGEHPAERRTAEKNAMMTALYQATTGEQIEKILAECGQLTAKPNSPG